MKKKIAVISISSAVLLGAVLTTVIIRSKNKNERIVINKAKLHTVKDVNCRKN